MGSSATSGTLRSATGPLRRTIVFREAVPVAFWEAVSVAKERSSARIASRIIAVWDVTTYSGLEFSGSFVEFWSGCSMT